MFYPVDIVADAYPMLQQSYRYTEITDEYDLVNEDMSLTHRYNVNVFPGLSTYTKDEFRQLCDGLVEDCKEQGIETLPTDELKAMIVAWKGGSDDTE